MTIREICIIVARVCGFCPRDVEENMSWVEVQVRFLDSMKIVHRVQQIQSATFVGSVGSFVAKKGDKTLIEEMNGQIRTINAFLGAFLEKGTIEQHERKKRASEANFAHGANVLAMFERGRKDGTVRGEAWRLK